MKYLTLLTLTLLSLTASAQQLRDCTAACFLEANAHAYKFDARPDGLIILTMKVEGKPTRVLFDTGAQTNAFRKQIGPKDDIVELIGANKTTLAHHCSVQVEDMVSDAVCVVDLPVIFDAILGQVYMHQFESVSINYREHVVTFVSRKTNDQ